MLSSTKFCIKLLVVAAYVVIYCRSNFVAEKGNLTVDFPPENRTTFEVYLADYGLPHYGAKITAELLYLGSEALEHQYSCDGEPDSVWNGLDCRYACNDMTKATPALNITKMKQDRQAGNIHYFLVADRGPYREPGYGTCNFLTKTVNAQKAGADGLIVISNTNRETTMETPDAEGSYAIESNITIGSVLMQRDDGEYLKKLMRIRDGHVPPPVIVTLDFSNLFTETKKVKYEIWRDSADACGSHCEQERQFLEVFSIIGKGLESEGYVDFEPHYIIWQCPHAYRDTEECQEQCINNGRYCIPDPDNEDLQGYKGRDVVMENFRELCVHKIGMDFGLNSLWWDYVPLFLEQCKMKDQNFDEKCAIQVFQQITDNDPHLFRQWQNCYVDTDKDEDIDLLKTELRLQGGEGTGDNEISSVVMNPTIRINGGQYRGSLNIVHVMKAICSAFEDGLEPKVCNFVAKTDCQPGQEGLEVCSNSYNTEHGTTKCVDTFMGYECVCEEGKMAVQTQGDEIFCQDVNQCTSLNTGCDCERCACVNKEGTYECQRDLFNPCEFPDNGGCWEEEIQGKTYSACVDNIEKYKERALQGYTDTPLNVCLCPPCFNTSSDGETCIPQCDLKLCNEAIGSCMQNSTVGAGSTTGKAGITPTGLVVFIVMTSVVVVSSAIFIIIYKRQTTRKEVRDIMKLYMKLPGESEQPVSANTQANDQRRERENFLGSNPIRSDSAQIRSDEFVGDV